ncbi:MAG: glycoside hydrolase family 127 protein [Acidobacteriota bacterium]|nr:glycoside hydrolase family 127 protein [Acidobacteriota bacterium]
MSSNFSRREFLAGAAAAALCSSAPQLAAEHAAAKDRLQEFDYQQVRLTGGPLKQQYDRIHANYLALDNDRLLKVYRERAGMSAPGEAMGGWYGADGFVPGHALGQYISGLARLGRSTGDEACHAKVGELVEGFAATMGAADRIYAGANAEKVWPCYILDKHLAGLMDAFSLSGVEQARALLPRVYRGALAFIPERGRDRVGKKDPPYDETYVLPENLFAAYEMTSERAMHDRAVAYLLDREFFDPLARGEDALPGRHAYSHAIALSSAGKARLALGEERYLRTLQNAWALLVSTQQYASGGWGPNETFIEPHKGQLYQSLQTTDDHFETPCGSYAATKLARYLLCATADGQYGDGLERIVYNALLSVKEPDSDGHYPYYSSYGARSRKTYYPHRWPCCSGTLVQGVADYVKNIYFSAPDGIAVNLYVPSELRCHIAGAAVTLIQQSDYPLGETAALRIDPAVPVTFTLRLRIPGWLNAKPSIRVNGRPASAEMQRGFAAVRRRWSAGDTVEVELPLSFRTEAIDDLHPDTVAVLHGPLLYVELNPPPGTQRLGPLDALRPLAGASGFFRARDASGERIHAPLYLVREESYTTYLQST